jgi:hypothetical protein
MYDSFTMTNLAVGMFIFILAFILAVAAYLDHDAQQSLRIAVRSRSAQNDSPPKSKQRF